MSDLCPKCQGKMDEGSVVSGFTPWPLRYRSLGPKRRFLALYTLVHKARACLNCGYLELYLDPEKLKRRVKAEPD